LLTPSELEEVIVSEWNPSRIALATAPDVPLTELFVNDVLNIGVSPRRLIEFVRARFEASGGVCLECTTLNHVDVFDDCVSLALATSSVTAGGSLGAGGSGLVSDSAPGSLFTLRSRLLVDCMGSQSPVAAQARGFAKPDSICVFVPT
jgi:lycopene cyclase CruP